MKTKDQHSRYLILIILILALIAVGFMVRLRSKNPSAELVFASGQEGGIYVELADEFSKLIQKEAPFLQIKILPSAGSVENVKLIDSGAAQLALVQNDIPGSSNLRTIAPLHRDYLHFLVRKNSGIQSFRDLSGRSFTTGLSGSGSLPVVEALMEYFSMSADTVVHKRSVGDGIKALKEGETDALLLTLGFRAPAIMELLKSSDEFELAHIPEIELEALAGFVLSYPICETIVMPPFSYGQYPDQPTPTIAIQTLLVAHRDVPREIIKPLTEVLFTHRAELIHQHPAAASMTESFSPTSISFPIHERARQYFSRDEPGFMIRYAETMAFLLSFLFACYGLFSATRKWISQKQKDRIDEHYLKIEEYIEKLENQGELSNREMDRIDRDVREIRKTAFEQLADEKLLPDASFLILQHLLVQCQTRIRELRGKIDPRKS